MEFHKRQLDNGLTIVAEVNDSAASMAAGFFVKTGSRDETHEISGVSHFLEHMVFKGTERRNAFDVNLAFDQMGANYNAFTSEENTVFYGAVLPEFQDKLLDLLSDILRPSLGKEDFEVEKNVIIDEIALYEDQPKFRVYDKLMADHFSPHPLGNSILGTTQSITDLQLAQMRSYFDRRYSPGNITVAGVGKMDFDRFAGDISEACSHWETFEVTRDTARSEGSKQTTAMCDQKVLREHIGLMSAAPSRQQEDRYAAELLATVVGDVTGSRLYYALVDPAIADEATMSYSPMDGTGGLITFLSSESDKASQALSIAQQVLKDFVEEGPTEQELQAAKNKIASGATLKGELPMGRLASVGFEWMYLQEYRPLAEHIEILFAVDRQQVHQVAREYDLAGTTVVALGPIESL